jgi:hypothetical protein
VVAAWVRGRKREVERSRAAASRCEDNGVSVRRLPRRPPTLFVEVELEQKPRLRLTAATFEDERRLVEWLRRTRTLDGLSDVLAHLLDVLDEREAA